MASPELAYYDAGMSVNYDKIVSGDGYQWLFFTSVTMATAVIALANSLNKKANQAVLSILKISLTSGFDVRITNVSGGEKSYQRRGFPVWTARTAKMILYGTKPMTK